jgi:SAM-dependent methyltransferase
MTAVPDRTTFETLYAGGAPWDIGKPQHPFLEAADQIQGSVLDAGCGTGDTALFLAGRGCQVTGIDFLDVPIERARHKAAQRGLAARFLVRDALTLSDRPERFDNAVDSGLFHVFSDEDRRRYVAGLATVLRGWAVESIRPARVEVRPDLKDMSFSEGGPRAWFAVIRRAG